MSGPFPGMDPWLEDACIWQGVHNAFIVYAAEALQALIRPRFVAAVEARVYIATVGRNIVPDIILRHAPRERMPGAARLCLNRTKRLFWNTWTTKSKKPTSKSSTWKRIRNGDRH